MHFLRRKRRYRIPFYARLFAIAGVVYGLVRAERHAPLLTARLGWKTVIDLAFRLYRMEQGKR